MALLVQVVLPVLTQTQGQPVSPATARRRHHHKEEAPPRAAQASAQPIRVRTGGGFLGGCEWGLQEDGVTKPLRSLGDRGILRAPPFVSGVSTQ